MAVSEAFFGLLTLGALAQEIYLRHVRGDLNLSELWSYFTYQSNALAAIVLLASSFPTGKGIESKKLDWIRGAATLYMIVTGVVYSLLVNNADPARLIDHYIMHYLMPVVMVALWVYHRPAWRIPNWTALAWLMYPMLYLSYVQAYAHHTGVWLYSFLDPTKDLLRVELTVMGLIAGSALVALGMAHLPLRRVTHRVT